MLIIEPRSGLCNRMRVLNSARALARDMGHELVVIWGIDYDLGASFDEMFEPLDGIEAWHEFDCRTDAGRAAREAFLRDARADVTFDEGEVEALRASGFWFPSLKDKRAIHIRTWAWLHPAEGLSLSFTPRPHLRSRIADTIASFSKTIGVHIRRTDNHRSIDNSPTLAFIVRMRQSLALGEAENFFLATDDPHEEATLAAAFPGKIISAPKRSLDRNMLEAMEDAVVDLFCLAATTRVFRSYYSIFSETAALIGGIGHETMRVPLWNASDATVLTIGIPLKTVTDPAERRFRSRMLSATLAAIYAQTDGAFHILVAGNAAPDLDIPVDDRLEFVEVAGKPTKNLHEARMDGGRKTEIIARRHAERGGGYLMMIDMDDFVSNRLVEFIRANPHPHGYLIDRGYTLNVRSNRYVPSEDFHKLCGSSAVLNITPQDVGGPGSRFSRLRSAGHYMVAENAIEEGRPLLSLPFRGAVWVFNHGGNLSKLADAQQAQWVDNRQVFLETINRTGSPSSDLADEFSAPARYPLLEDYLAAAGRTPPPTLSVVIATYRRPAGLQRLLKALMPQITGNREVIVVNDGSHDDAYEAVRLEFADRIKYRALPGNVGVAEARNASVELASGDYLVFTDDDCEPPAWWLDWLEERLQWEPGLDVVAGWTIPMDPKRWTFFSRVQAAHSLLPSAWKSLNGIMVVTANAAIRRSLFLKAGGFGFPGKFHGAGEDTELSMRLRRAAASICFDASWYVRHEVGEGIVAACRRNWRYGYANGAMMRLTTAPQFADQLDLARRKEHWHHWITTYRQQRQNARRVSSNRLAQIASTLLATVVAVAYFDGAAAALRDRDRRRAALSG